MSITVYSLQLFKMVSHVAGGVCLTTQCVPTRHFLSSTTALESFFFVLGSSYLLLLVSLFNGISTLFMLFNAKAILLEEQYYLTHSWEDKGVHTFPKGICPK